MTNNGNVGQDTMCACHALSYCLLPLPMLLLLLVLPNSTEQTAFSCKCECGSIYYCSYGMILANLHYLTNGFSQKVPFAYRYTVERVANTFADCTGEFFNLLTCIVDALTQNWLLHISQHNYHTLWTMCVGVCVC